MLTGSSVLITGATEGIGRGLALAAASAGAVVSVTGLDRQAAETVADEIRRGGGSALAVRCDVTSRDDIEAAIAATLEAFGRLDGFVHNANLTGSRARSIEDIGDVDWDMPVVVGLRPIFTSAQAALPALITTKGSMVILTSPAGIDGTATLPVYSTIKAAQRALMKSLAREWGPLGVRVNALSPSAVTPALEAFLEREPHMRSHMIARSPLGRMGDAERDIGRAVNFLIGRDSGFITGQTLIVSGGAMML